MERPFIVSFINNFKIVINLISKHLKEQFTFEVFKSSTLHLK